MAEKREQDNLCYQQALKNYCTQLKILSSVKAALIKDSRDMDASFALDAVTRDAIFGGKVPKIKMGLV